MVVGTALIVCAGWRQPYNQNELQQLNVYGADTIAEIVGGTRQPPLDPLLGAGVQRLAGVGQLQQRLVPMLAGAGTLIVLSAVFLRAGMGAAGAAGVWLLATAPLMVRYSAYARPYALPVLLMVLLVYFTQRWLAGRR
ncbi:MAG: glycosyltransferase family 39 protein, partial [Euzebyales bacterium]|nr:glycosyltransferase family 39 protein [Euzebyales bacterium]